MKKIFLILTLIILSTAVINAQQVFCPTQEYTQGHTDSTGFVEYYYFDLPEKALINVEAQLLGWINSADGAAHLSIDYYYAYRISNYTPTDSTQYKLSGNSTQLSADYSTEGVSSWTIAAHADDDPENAVDSVRVANALVLKISGASSNRADTEYAFTVAYDVEED